MKKKTVAKYVPLLKKVKGVHSGQISARPCFFSALHKSHFTVFFFFIFSFLLGGGRGHTASQKKQHPL
ncbi:MAG: hypothetical protein IPH62_15265 [Ignavibacteriae bacterium]|nr:hypothetical protein [Ignavibacteriota bacterium]